MSRTFLLLLIVAIVSAFALSVGGCAKKKTAADDEMATTEERVPQPGEPGYEKNLAALQSWMLKNRLEAVSQPRIAGYDPPWTLPFLRRNEIIIDIKL